MGLLVHEFYGRAESDGTVLGGLAFNDLSPVQNAVEFAQPSVDFADAHTPVGVCGVLAAVALGGGGLDLVDHGRALHVLELFPFGLELLETFF